MRQMVTSLSALILCLSVVLLASCIRLADIKQSAKMYSDDKWHFCKAFYEQFQDERQLLGLCFKYPKVAAGVHNEWFWLDKHTLLAYKEEQLRLKEQQLTTIEKQLDKENTSDDENLHEEHVIDIDLVKLDPTKPVVYLTFDDGPGKYTDQVLDILEVENIKATFFVLGIQVKKNPLFTKRIVEDGHTIGNHTYDHDYKTIYEDFSEFAEQVIETNRIIYELTGTKVNLFRAPGGSINNLDEGYFRALTEAGFKVFDWNVDSKDSHSRTIAKDKIVGHIKDSLLHDPAIVLLHDTTSHEQSMLALPEIIEHYKTLGYQFAPLTDETNEVTFRLGKHLKWVRKAVTDSQIEKFKVQVEQLYEEQ